MVTILIILGRVLASPFVNLFQKKLTNKIVSPELIVAACYLFFVLLSIPFFVYLQPFNLPYTFWIYIGLLGIIDIFGNVFLVKSLQRIDLSVFGPLNSYKPVFALVVGVFLLGEIPSVAGMLGIVVIIAGSYLLAYQPGVKRGSIRQLMGNKGIIFRFLAIALTSLAAVLSKKAIMLSSPLITLMYWAVIGLPFSLVILYRSNHDIKSGLGQLKRNPGLFAALFSAFLCLQLFTLLTFAKVFVGYSLALFQLSAVVSVFFGFHFFNEQNIKYRLIGSLIMVGGAILIAAFG